VEILIQFIEKIFTSMFTLKAIPLASSKLHEVASARVPSARPALKAAWTSSWTVEETVQVWPDPGVSSVPCHTLSVVATGMVPRYSSSTSRGGIHSEIKSKI
jgi:hypothetical protein